MEIVNITYAGLGNGYQEYSEKDQSLLSSNYITPRFGLPEDYVEMFIISEESSIIFQNYGYDRYRPFNSDPFTGYFSSVEIDPYEDAKFVGIDRGVFYTQYNFLRNIFNSSISKKYWIKDISPSRTELRLDTQDLSDEEVLLGFETFQSDSSVKNYKNDFYLNFGSNRLILCTNVAYEVNELDRSYILIKLYSPLPQDFSEKDELWIVEKAAESVSYRVQIDIEDTQTSDAQYLRGPNFSIKAIDQVTQTTNFYNYNSLFSSNISSSIQQLKSWMEDKSVRINVDFSNFENFIHFSSAKERVYNFVYKLELIESYTSQIQDLYSYELSDNYTGSISSSVSLVKDNIDRIIEKFDLYEYHLYFSSGSSSWPKINSEKPYQLYSVTSSQAQNWLGNESVPNATILYSASIYDAENQNKLTNSIPGYLVEDDLNGPFITFMDMVGQHFDNVWLYYKDLSNRYVNNNDPNSGISLDVVGDCLKNFGIELYTNTNLSENIYYNLFGVNEDGSILPPTGSEMISQYVTSSIDTIPPNDVHKEIYKRLYHNLPYLLKTKGTQRGIKALISCYGIPSEILTVKEFGGQNRYNSYGVLDENNQKITYSTSSYDINSETLSPFATLQYFDNDRHRNSLDIEVGFTPSDIFDAHITSSLGNLFVEGIINQPGYALSSSYDSLDFIKRQYFSQYYVKRFNIWDYIRVIKYYNNSLFKLINDFVPARANLHTGVIIKSHLLERNKYVKRDPSADYENNISESINLLDISGYHAGHIDFHTDNFKTFTVPSGSFSYEYTDNRESYNGELGGSLINPRDSNYFNQSEISSITNPEFQLGNITRLYEPNLNNVTESRRSRRFIDLDYSYRQLIPVNIEQLEFIFDGLSTGSLNYKSLYDDRNIPMSYVQDYYYYTNAFTIPRYYGSKTISKEYLYYNEGDSSYGKKAAIDKIKYQFAYLVDIYTASFNLNKRSNAQIKYIIDNDQNVLDLTKTNTNIFYTQNIFKSGESINISLFDYDPINPDVQFLTNNSNLKIYEGGWRYSPISYKINGECIWYRLPEPIIDTSRTISAPTIEERVPTNYTFPRDFNLRVRENIVTLGNGTTLWTNSFFIVELDPAAPTPTSNLYVSINYPDRNGNYTLWSTVTILAGQRIGQQTINNPNNGTISSQWNDSTVFMRGVVERVEIPGQDVIISRYLDSIQDCEDLYVVNSQEIMLTQIQSDPLYYGKIIMSQSVDVPGMEVPVFPFQLQTGDMLKFYSPTAGWIEQEEYRVVSLRPSNDSSGSFRWIVKTDKQINPEIVSNQRIPGFISKYIINKHVPDETNIILRYDPKSQITQDGIVYPEYIDVGVKDLSGDTIKNLKSQNLI